jgi:hypothetical protein
VDENGEPRYRFGYGHGYHRFTTLASQLEMHRDMNADAYRTQMTEAEALVMLQSVAQNEETAAVGRSWTQFSCRYRNAEETFSVWSFQDWEVAYTFNTNGDRLSERASGTMPMPNAGHIPLQARRALEPELPYRRFAGMLQHEGVSKG